MRRGKYAVILSSRADLTLARHIEFMARVDSKAARNLLADFRTASARIGDNPLMFPYADETDIPGIPKETYRKCLFHNRYKAIYIFENETAYIDVIIDCRQKNDNLF
ncbi:MAG: hypothetical protein LBR61_04475 [Synergistaceae bacterium]|jgi:plasmid stabilization system protein ParE|nr:hypothetical protein [Synergistaceae bacterium]